MSLNPEDLIEEAQCVVEVTIENKEVEEFNTSDISLIKKEADYDIIMESITDSGTDIILGA